MEKTVSSGAKEKEQFGMNYSFKCWRIPIFPERRHSSIFGTTELNFCVRDGNRWTLCVNLTNYSVSFTMSRDAHRKPNKR